MVVFDAVGVAEYHVPVGVAVGEGGMIKKR